MNGSSLQEASWYDHDDDMAALSAEFPDILFTLYGIGESPDDQWKKYYKYGKLQREDRTEIRFPEVKEEWFTPDGEKKPA